jgi:hypothetical protein
LQLIFLYFCFVSHKSTNKGQVKLNEMARGEYKKNPKNLLKSEREREIIRYRGEIIKCLIRDYSYKYN